MYNIFYCFRPSRIDMIELDYTDSIGHCRAYVQQLNRIGYTYEEIFGPTLLTAILNNGETAQSTVGNLQQQQQTEHSKPSTKINPTKTIKKRKTVTPSRTKPQQESPTIVSESFATETFVEDDNISDEEEP